MNERDAASITRPLERRGGWRRWMAPLSGIVLGIILIGGLAFGVMTYFAGQTAQQNKATLDRALAKARDQYHTPPSLLAPIIAAEQRTAHTTDGSYGGYKQASEQYAKLTSEVTAIVQMSPAQARAMTQTDLGKFKTGVDGLVKGNYIEAAGYQSRFAQAKTQFATAASLMDYFKLDSFVQDQVTALGAFKPTYSHLQALTKLVQDETALLNGPLAPATSDLQCAQGLVDTFWLDDPLIQVKNTQSGVVTTPESKWPASDLALFRAAKSSADYTALDHLITVQTQQVYANETNLLPGVVTNLMQTFQADINTLKAQKLDTSTIDQLYSQDVKQAQTVAAKPSLTAYTAFVKTLRKHQETIQLPLIKAKTANDLQTLKQLIAKGQALTTTDPANGIAYPNAYEYADPNTGIGDATERLAVAQTAEDYQLVDNELLMFITNIQAMIQNLNDKTAWNQPHQTDLQLMNHYGVTPYPVIVVSLREQAARLYDNGKMIKAFQVTTGAPDLPSVAGLHCVLDRMTNTYFKSPDPPTSPNYYKPTFIHFAMDYSYYGYALHDAWWRSWFGKYSNLPHYDPAAFNGGSHGCINFSLTDAQYVFNFAQIGTPVIVY